MNRTLKKKKTEVDYTKPIEDYKYKLVDGDCFGKGWSPKHNLCKICSDNMYCGTVFELHTKAKAIANIENTSGKFLDLFREPTINFLLGVTDLINTRANQNKPINVVECLDLFMVECRTDNRDVAKDRFIKYLTSNPFIMVDKGYCYIKQEYVNNN